MQKQKISSKNQRSSRVRGGKRRKRSISEIFLRAYTNPVNLPTFKDIKTPKGYGDKIQTLEEDRGKIYGDPFLSHQAIGLAWEGVFRNRYHDGNYYECGHPEVGKLFPPDLVAEMLAAFKIIRLTRPIFKQDSADDAKVYISFSERFRK